MSDQRILMPYNQVMQPQPESAGVLPEAEAEIDRVLEEHWEKLNQELLARIQKMTQSSYRAVIDAKQSMLKYASVEQDHCEQRLSFLGYPQAPDDYANMTTEQLIDLLRQKNYDDDDLEKLQQTDVNESELVGEIFDITAEGVVGLNMSSIMAPYRIKGWHRIRRKMPKTQEFDMRAGLLKRVFVHYRPNKLTRKRK